MRLSALQRSILRECYQLRKSRTPRPALKKFYKGRSQDSVDSITKSLERLIDKGLLIGYGRRTPKKWFIEEVRLTPLGRRIAKLTLGQQQHLPFKQ
jgi:hypothetical protein